MNEQTLTTAVVVVVLVVVGLVVAQWLLPLLTTALTLQVAP